MADGHFGREYEVYPYVKDSSWLQPRGGQGGTEYSNLNEALPYWFNSMRDEFSIYKPPMAGLDRPHLVAHDAEFLNVFWENMDMFHARDPIKWHDWYTDETYPKVVNPPNDNLFAYIHGVNVGQGLKSPAVIYRINGTQFLVQKSYDAVELTFRHHGSASGTTLADEKQTGLAPYMGILGRNDRAERAIFNAFPVMFTGNKWAHKYLDQPNQPRALNMTGEDGHVPPVFTTARSGVVTTFGMEPQYPCCTVNHGQGYPKFLSNSWVSIGATGVAHVLLGPSEMSTIMDGSRVEIKCDTMYPFSMQFVYHGPPGTSPR
ncbi:hypothetical protein E4U58_007608 [Claviceps cyperi]|nr:hypothetical protein E4U58_007608 [Claviceps cyperi]